MKTLEFKVDFNSVVKLVDDVIIPKMYKMRQHFETPRLSDYMEKLKKELEKKKRILKTLKGKRYV